MKAVTGALRLSRRNAEVLSLRRGDAKEQEAADRAADRAGFLSREPVQRIKRVRKASGPLIKHFLAATAARHAGHESTRHHRKPDRPR